MSKLDGVILASRILALYWASWALSEMTYMPERVLSLSHYTGQPDGYSLYMHNQYSTIIASLVVRIIALSIAALAFWSCGPKVARLFLAPAGIENPA